MSNKVTDEIVQRHRQIVADAIANGAVEQAMRDMRERDLQAAEDTLSAAAGRLASLGLVDCIDPVDEDPSAIWREVLGK